MPAELNIPTRLETPKGLRIHIGLFGRRNAGKSSLINALTNQQIAIVSDVPGTTTDPVEKACELAPVGPVVFIDTAGIDDGELPSVPLRLRIDPVPGNARNVLHNGLSFSDNTVEKCGFSYIRPSYDR